MARKNLLALAVLSYLTQGPMHPYELSRTLKANGDERSIRFTHSSLYMVVTQLAKAGLIAPVETSRDGLRPERTVYALTDAGRVEARAWLRELIGEPEQEFPQFVTALSLIGALGPDEVVTLLRTRLDRLATLRDDATAVISQATASGVHPLFVIEEDYRVAMLDAERAFVEHFIRQITKPRGGWRPQWTEFHAARNEE
jgi:DNA-binding PadR family transcriptional regulator